MFKRTRPAITAPAPVDGQYQPVPDRVTMWWLVAALALVVLPHLPRLPTWYLPLLLATIAERMSHYYWHRPPVPGAIRVALVGASVIGLYLQYGPILNRGPGVALLCVMLALKLLECYRRREVYLLVTMAYFVVVTQFLFSQQVAMLLYMTGTVVVITGVLLVLELQPTRQSDQFALSKRTLLPQLRTAGWLLVQCVPLMVVLFLLFPRLSAPMWGTGGDGVFGRTGISGEMSPGQIGQLFLDDSPAFRATFEGPPPQRSNWYWRGPVLWDYDGETWRRPIRVLRSKAELADDATESATALRYQVTMERSSRHWLFGLDVPLLAPNDGGLQIDHTLYRLKPVSRLHSYEMVSDPNFVLDPELTATARRAALALPAGSNPLARQLAQRWRSELGDDPITLANRVLRMFRQEEYYYSFDAPPLAGQKMDDFLFNTRTGYCEFYSSAFAVLMRSAGVPTRVVTGYMGGYYNPRGGYVLVRNSDAHAWNEIWIEQRGWVRYDPTAAVAPERVDRGALAAIGQTRGALDYGWLRALRDRFDGVQYLWNDWIVKFSLERQRGLLQPFGVNELQQRDLLVMLVLLVAPFVGFMMFWLVRAQRLAGNDRIDRLYHRFCARLAKLGVKKLPQEGPRDFAQRAGIALATRKPWIDMVTGCYIAAKYQPEPRPELEQRLARLLRRRASDQPEAA